MAIIFEQTSDVEELRVDEIEPAQANVKYAQL